jgi:hypothetical protein
VVLEDHALRQRKNILSPVKALNFGALYNNLKEVDRRPRACELVAKDAVE